MLPGFLCSLVPVLQPHLLFKSSLGSWNNSLVFMALWDLRFNGLNACGLAPGWSRRPLQHGPRVGTPPFTMWPEAGGVKGWCLCSCDSCDPDLILLVLWSQRMQCASPLRHPLRLISNLCSTKILTCFQKWLLHTIYINLTLYLHSWLSKPQSWHYSLAY